MTCSNASAAGGPMIRPTDPVAEAIASDIDRFSSLDARPMIASMTPKPVMASTSSMEAAAITRVGMP